MTIADFVLVLLFTLPFVRNQIIKQSSVYKTTKVFLNLCCLLQVFLRLFGFNGYLLK